jgi:hypothetical protein
VRALRSSSAALQIAPRYAPALKERALAILVRRPSRPFWAALTEIGLCNVCSCQKCGGRRVLFGRP